MKLLLTLFLSLFLLTLLTSLWLDYLSLRHQHKSYLIQEMYEKQYHDRLRIRQLHLERNMAWRELNLLRHKVAR